MILLCGLALGAGPEVWAALHNGRLVESAERDPGAALAIYDTLLEHLDSEDPMRGDILYSLGRARYAVGDVDGARLALREASRDPDVGIEARTWLGQLNRAEQAVEGLPFRQTFEQGRGPWVRGWPLGLDDDLVVGTSSPGGAALIWTVEVQDGVDDHILLPLRPGERPLSRLRLQMRSTSFDAQVRVVLEDSSGRYWSAPVIDVVEGGWLPVDLFLNSFSPADAPADRRRPDGRSITAIYLREVTAFHSANRGLHQLLIDDVDLR